MSAAPAEIEPRPTSAPPPAGERPVFAAPSGRRLRVLRIVGLAAAALAATWLIALVLGAFGFDALPGVTLPGESQITSKGDVATEAQRVRRRGSPARVTHLPGERVPGRVVAPGEKGSGRRPHG